MVFELAITSRAAPCGTKIRVIAYAIDNHFKFNNSSSKFKVLKKILYILNVTNQVFIAVA